MSANRKGDGMRNLMILWLAMLLSFGAAAQADAPYLYYYSHIVNGFIIERADGTDSRLFAQGISPADHAIIEGPGWSPDGRWFVWLSSETYFTKGSRDYDIWIVNNRGDRATLLDGLDGFVDAYWSGTGNLFLLDKHGILHRVDLDTAEVTLVAAQDAESPVLVGNSATGMVSEPVSPDGRFRIALESGTLIDNHTATTVVLHPFSKYYYGQQVCGVEWSTSSEWFLRGDDTRGGVFGCGAGIVVANTLGTVHRELSNCSFGGRACAGWLPYQVISSLAVGQRMPIIPDPRLTLRHEGDVVGIGWRADGNAVAVVEIQFAKFLHRLLIWTRSGEQWNLSQSFEVHQCSMARRRPCHVSWSPDGRRVAINDRFDSQIVTLESGDIMVSEELFAGWSYGGEAILSDSPSDAEYDPRRNRIARVAETEYGHPGLVEIVDFASGDVLYTQNAPQTPEVVTVSFLGDGKGLVVATILGLFVWHFEQNTLTQLSHAPFDYMHSVKASDRFILAYGHSGHLYIYESQTAAIVAVVNRYVSDAAFSPDGRTLATVAGRAVDFWDVNSLVR
jgi:Tol biopolymer transport system component